MHPSGIWVPIVLFISMAVMAIGVPIARAYARRIDRVPSEPAVSPELAAQIERMEHAIDSIAIEVERISEGQRFTTKLLADRSNAPAGVVSAQPGPGAR
jgi:hypothetical protein